MLRICFVCLGNICRSPTAEGVMRHLLEQEGLLERFYLDSAGTSAYHSGEPPDRRSSEAALRRGVRLTGRARQFTREDFEEFDYVLAMDGRNLEDLKELAGARYGSKVRLFRDFDPQSEASSSVPDPYHGGESGFEHVLDLCGRAARGLLEELRRRGELA